MNIENILAVIKVIQEHGSGVVVAFLFVLSAIGGLIKALESFLQLIAPLTSWKWDDNLATKLGKWAALKIFNKKV